MSNRNKFSLVTFILLLLLIAALVNFIFVFHASNSGDISVAVPGAPTAKTGAAPVTAPMRRAPPAAGAGQMILPSWYGDAYLTSSPAGGYDIVIEAFGHGSHTLIAVDSVEADLRRAGSATAGVTPKFEQPLAGKYVGHVDLPAGGSWEVRVRMHRGTETLEFAEKFDIE